jgi:predicted transcriptional regulator
MTQDDSSYDSRQLMQMTTKVISAYVQNNPLPATDLPAAIQAVHSCLKDMRDGVESPPLRPAIPIKKSVTPDYLVCLEDGKKLKMLKRHLRSTYNMTPEEYRAKWGLGPDYPMVAPNYAAERSEFARQIGLGRNSNRKTKQR